MGIFDGLKRIVGTSSSTELLEQANDSLMKTYQKKVAEINAYESKFESLTNDQLRDKTEYFKNKLKYEKSVTLDSLLVEAFAVAREATWRVLEMSHFDVQLIGGMALHDGKLAEMATGEGKTLVAILPVYLNALTGDGAFVVTTNDYLARRDGEMMGQVFKFLGLSVGIVQSYQKEIQRKTAYNCDVTYVSNQELGFDYLRDNLAMSTDNIVQTTQRSFSFCVVDEADSILIDEARTPLIISRKGAPPTEKYITSAKIAETYLIKDQHYEVNEKDQKIDITPGGYKYAEQILGKSLFDLADPWAFYIINAIKAKELFAENKEYIINNKSNNKNDGSISIIDSFTGRVLEGRRFTDGIQQSIEAKEGLKVTSETQVVAKVTYQNLFKLFDRLSGMSGTLITEADELRDVYGMSVFPIPTALPIARRDNPDAVFRTKQGKLKALLKNVLTTHEKGRPVLIGTTSIESSEEMLEALTAVGITGVKILNARPENVERESEIVSQAGRMGAVTVATNMAGRGTDIILGGSAKGLVTIILKHMLLVKLGVIKTPDYKNKAMTMLENKEKHNESVKNEENNKEEVEESDFMKAINNKDRNEKKSGEKNNDFLENDSSSSSVVNDTVHENVEEGEEEEEEETDPDVLALPAIQDVIDFLDLSLPVKKGLKKSTELLMKRAVISAADMLENNNSINQQGQGQGGNNVAIDRIAVEDVISRAAEYTPLERSRDGAMKLLRTAVMTASEEIDGALKAEKEVVKRLGGLYVIGTARHESRRIDLQLRGRAGRQGDPGASRFFLSLEDDIFKIFGADKLSGILDNFRVAEDMPIESDLVVQALDKVQIQVEDYYRSTRKQVYKLDEITSVQRNAVYSQRRAFLTSSDEGMIDLFSKYCLQTMKEIFQASYTSSTGTVSTSSTSNTILNAEKLVAKAAVFFPNIALTVQDVQYAQTQGRGDVKVAVGKLLDERLLAAIAVKRGEVDAASANAWAFVSFFRYLALVQTDESWCKHLTRLDLLKEEMILQSFTAERDVVEVYREKAFKIFETLLDDIRRNTVYSLFIYKPPQQQ